MGRRAIPKPHSPHLISTSGVKVEASAGAQKPLAPRGEQGRMLGNVLRRCLKTLEDCQNQVFVGRMLA